MVASWDTQLVAFCCARLSLGCVLCAATVPPLCKALSPKQASPEVGIAGVQRLQQQAQHLLVAYWREVQPVVKE